MKSGEEFQLFYRSTLVPIVDGLELERQKFVKKIYFAGAAAALLLALYGFFGTVTVTHTSSGDAISGGVSEALFYIVIAGALGYFFWYRPRSKALNVNFKNEVINRIVKFIDQSLEYDPTDGISRIEFMQSNIFDWSGDRFLSEDLVKGKLDQTSIRFSEVHTQQKKELKGKGQSSPGFTRWVTLFRGIIFIADFNKHFKGRTVVLADQAEKTFGSLGTLFQKMNSQRDPVVKMENQDFERAFVVYSSDSLEARYILSPSLMERIVSLKQKFGNIQLSFFNSVVFVSMPMKKNLFEVPIFSPINAYSAIENYYNQLQQITGIVEELNLNNRIWTKE